MSVGEHIEHFAEADAEHLSGRQLAAVREAAPAFASWFGALGTCEAVETCDLIELPYPRRFAMWRAATSPAPFVRIFNRMMVVQFLDAAGKRRTLLVEPTEWELAANTPFFARLASSMPNRARERVVVEHGTVQSHLALLGIAPEDVDYLTFDHLHTQDLRVWLGTTAPQPDLVAVGKAHAEEPVEPFFPNAKLLVMREEWEMLDVLHPLQQSWYQPATFADVRRDAVEVLDGDTLLGPGVALLRTAGHSLGNHTIVVNVTSGIWTQSENGVHPEMYQPERSRIPGVARHAREYGHEVILNANTPELTATQYNNMVKEKLIADRGGPDGEWMQHLCSSELTPWRLAPACSPSFTHGAISHGTLVD